jgi:S-adenosylmethionine synthetase
MRFGVFQPLSIYVDLHEPAGSKRRDLDRIDRRDGRFASRDPPGPIFSRTAPYGHFGRNPDDDGGFSWERVDLVDVIEAAL